MHTSAIAKSWQAAGVWLLLAGSVNFWETAWLTRQIERYS